ncbi:MAG TPA: histidinol dehydrogenase [Candidatus Kapabacteria bacterium]|nr:histidinol dehydrogenase [Candidatus Kapabacteria bacterium]
MLKRISFEKLLLLDRTSPLDDILPKVSEIVQNVRSGKDAMLRAYAEQFGDLESGAPLVIERAALEIALLGIDPKERGVLERTAERIRRFASAQRATLSELTFEVEGGFAGHRVLPLERAACYAPGGRYPLPSSVLMTGITARAAGVNTVWVASPKPSMHTLAAAAIASADAVLAVGGAHAIAALAHGTETIPRFDIIVGPGNRWVTAAKQLVAGVVKIDMLAGPSELAIVADASANPAWIAADLLAQAEHDPDARVFLIALDERMVQAVEAELQIQLQDLSTRAVARESIGKSFAVVVGDVNAAAEICNHLAPEHLSLQLNAEAIERLRPLLRHYGGLFIGSGSAEVLGDYGIGPNHVLPTQGSARVRGGLSVLDFLKIQTWMNVSRVPTQVSEDIQALARTEGLEAHRRSMAIRAA